MTRSSIGVAVIGAGMAAAPMLPGTGRQQPSTGRFAEG